MSKNSKDLLKLDRPTAMRWIEDLFNEKVRGKTPNTSGSNPRHDGKGGHWLEERMGIERNSNNRPDLLNFEMKNNTSNKTSFGDWSPDYFIFRTKTKNKDSLITRKEFLQIFGKPNELKGGRCSWSGTPFPKVGSYNSFGQILVIDKYQNIVALYRFSKDQRPNKSRLIPKDYQVENLILARWDAESIKGKFERKFATFGWFKCFQNESGQYDSITFGKPLTYEFFIEQFLNKSIYIDCGMYDGNIRPYMTWRCSNTFWATLPTDSTKKKAS